MTSHRPTSRLRLSLLCLSVLLLLLVSAPSASSFYLPGVAPRDYDEGEPINVKVIKLDSVKTQLPYDYYSLPFCRPDKIVEIDENLGEVLSGDQIENSPYWVHMKVVETCKVLCVMEYSDDELARFADKIEDEYRVNWLLDNIPAATKYYTVNVAQGAEAGQEGKQSEPVEHYEKGYALGFVGHADFPNSQPNVKYINNHLRLNIKHHHEDISASSMGAPVQAALDATVGGSVASAVVGGGGSSSVARIVGFEVEAYSVHHVIAKDFTYVKGETKLAELEPKLVTCTSTDETSKPQRVSHFTAADKPEDRRVIFTYDVQWEPSPIKWASRWDPYLKMTDSKIHWFSIINRSAPHRLRSLL